MDDFSRSSESAASVDETQVPASTVAHSAAAERDRHFERIVLAAGIVDPQSLEASRRHLAASGAQSLAELLVACGLISETARRAIEVLVGVQFAKGGADESTLVQSQSALESTITYAPCPGGEAAIPRSFGDYELLEAIARGGMGIVYRARQTRLNRIVALKMIRSGDLADEREVRRFQTEAEAAAQLDHPGIVPVYEVGRVGAEHFYSMAYVTGQNLNDRVKADGPQPPSLAAQLLKTVAEAVQFAHEHGIIHRDIKPRNILLDEKQQPRVTDFGLAKQSQGASDLTSPGQALGTPSYMSPEQAAGALDKVGPASDVYSLGATLYFLLTARPPFQAATGVETVRQVIDADPAPPRRVNPAIPVDLETICLKCLRKEPGGRYGTAAELAADLGRWLEHKPILARPVGVRERAVLWCRRRPGVARLLVGFAALSLIVSTGFVWMNWSVRAEGLVDQLLHADIRQVPSIITKLDGYRRWADPLLAAKAQAGESDSNKRLRAALALLPVDGRQAEYLRDQLPVVTPEQFAVVRDELSPHQAVLVEPLWQMARGAPEPAQRFRAACALATYAPRDGRWNEIADGVTAHLMTLEASQLVIWREALYPARQQLLGSLAATYRRQGERDLTRTYAAETLAEFAFDSPDLLFELLADAELFHFATVYGRLAKHAGRAVELAAAELAGAPARDHRDADKDQLARRKANAAAMLCRLGRAADVWPLLAASPDPRARSEFIHRAAPVGCDPALLESRLDDEPDASARRALLLCLGEFTEAQLPVVTRNSWADRLAAIYEQEPDAGLHAAAEWLLRRWNETERLDAISTRLRVNEEQRLAFQATESRNWYINTQGQTFAVLEPDDFLMGSPPGEPGNNETERLHRRRIGRRIAIAAHEVTKEQYGVFLKEFPKFDQRVDTSPWVKTPDSPQVGMIWYDAAAYCNWLSGKEGIPCDQWCYEPLAQGGKYAPGMRARSNAAELSGYRLPTEAEWEYACRAGTATSRYYGAADSLLAYYARFQANGENMTGPVGRLKPNDFGLFDMLGNVHEICHDPFRSRYPAEVDGLVTDPLDLEPVTNDFPRAHRGGSFGDAPVDIRSANRGGNPPNSMNYMIGFRPARTCP